METMEIARVTSKGQITIPVSIRKILGIKEGDKVMFVGKGENIRIMNASMNALKDLQNTFAGEAEKMGIKDEQDVVAMVKSVRAERAKENEDNTRY